MKSQNSFQLATQFVISVLVGMKDQEYLLQTLTGRLLELGMTNVKLR